jgi:hypothetical protein
MINLTKNDWKELGERLVFNITDAEIMERVLEEIIDPEDKDYDSIETEVLERIRKAFK